LPDNKSGRNLFCLLNKAGNRAAVTAGMPCSIHYKGTLLTGEEFDSSVGGEPIKFPVGMSYVIQVGKDVDGYEGRRKTYGCNSI
jgi:FKBP-type peptidyl-prolyl cis-trans isomerase